MYNFSIALHEKDKNQTLHPWSAIAASMVNVDEDVVVYVDVEARTSAFCVKDGFYV